METKKRLKIAFLSFYSGIIERGVETLIPEIAERLISLGITSLSVNPDSIERSRELAYNIERRHFNFGLIFAIMD